MRWAIGGVGVAAGLYGAFLLWSRADTGEVAEAALWLAGGVVAHDLLIAAVTLLLAALATRLLPPPARTPAAVALVVLGPLTLLAVPFLGRFGAKEDNPTLLDRPYVTGYLVLVAAVLLVLAVGTLVRRLSSTRSPTPPRR